MCLHISGRVEEQTNSVRNKMKENPNKVMFWKIYTLYGDTLLSPARGCKVVLDKDGFIVSDRESIGFIAVDEIYWGEVQKGIHVYTSKNTAEAYKGSSDRIFEVQANPEDLVAVSKDESEAVFTKIKLVGRTAKKYFPQLKKTIKIKRTKTKQRKG